MEKATVIALLEKYWQAETTIAEEQALAGYFQGAQIDPELEAYRDMFSYFQEETRISAGPDFGNRILQRLGLPLDGQVAGDTTVEHEAGARIGQGAPEVPVVPMTRRSFRLGVMAAAAAILLIVAGLFLLRPVGPPTMLADTQTAAGAHDNRLAAERPDTQEAARAREMQEARATADNRITDTYDDPRQALAAVRRALLVASRNLNQSRREITGTSK
jgi:hypothetical protein